VTLLFYCLYEELQDDRPTENRTRYAFVECFIVCMKNFKTTIRRKIGPVMILLNVYCLYEELHDDRPTENRTRDACVECLTVCMKNCSLLRLL